MALGWTISRHGGEVGYESQYTGQTVLDNSGDGRPRPVRQVQHALHDANGGWLASAVTWSAGPARSKAEPGAEQHLDRPGLRQPAGLGVNPDGWYYGLGWAVRPVTGGTGRNIWHTGSFAGTYSLLVRTYHGLSWAAVFNRRDDPSGLSYAPIDSALWTAASAVTSWPTHDFWPTYFA